MPEQNKALAPREVAENLGLSLDSVYRRIYDGSIPSFRVGRSLRIPAWFVSDLMRRPGELPSARKGVIR